MRVLDLFSGIGGFSIGLERAGMTTVAFCEIEPFCRAVLRKHWPHVPIYDDVRDLTAVRLAADGIGVDVICGGFPCQDISNAGRRAGMAGERSGLWSEYARIIGEFRPRYVIVENVAALLGRGIDRVLGDLAALGFDAEWHCIPASAVGAPHQRDRLWIVAYARDDGHGLVDAARCDSSAQGETQGTRHQWQRLRSFSGGSCTSMAHADKSRLEGRLRASLQECSGQWASRSSDPLAYAARELSHRGGTVSEQTGRRELADGSWWVTEPDVGRSDDGLPGWLDRYVGRGMSYAESRRATEALRGLWSPHVSAALRRSAGRLERLQQAEVLFTFLREYEAGTDEARLLVAGKEAFEDFLRSLRERAQVRSPSRRSGSRKQRPVEHPDAVQSVSRLLACDSEAAWAGSGWEDAVPRIANNVAARVDRLRGLGNAVVPQIPEIIGRAIMTALSATEAAR